MLWFVVHWVHMMAAFPFCKRLAHKIKLAELGFCYRMNFLGHTLLLRSQENMTIVYSYILSLIETVIAILTVTEASVLCKFQKCAETQLIGPTFCQLDSSWVVTSLWRRLGSTKLYRVAYWIQYGHPSGLKYWSRVPHFRTQTKSLACLRMHENTIVQCFGKRICHFMNSSWASTCSAISSNNCITIICEGIYMHTGHSYIPMVRFRSVPRMSY